MPKGTIGFRPLGYNDLPLVFRWRNTPHVLRWWGKQDLSTMEAIRAKYAPRIEGNHPCHCFVILIDQTPVGLIQTFLLGEDPRYVAALKTLEGAVANSSYAGATSIAGVDIFIGEVSYIYQGWGAQVLRSFLQQQVFRDESVSSCIIDPDLSNTAAIRAYEKAGFTFVKTVQFPGDDEPAYVMSMSRDDLDDDRNGSPAQGDPGPQPLAQHIRIVQQLIGDEKSSREHYALFSPGRIGPLSVPNRLVRSATWDPSILDERVINEQTLNVYRDLACGGVGTIITGDFSVLPAGSLEDGQERTGSITYERIRIRGFAELAAAVHDLAPEVAIIAQISADYPGVSSSSVRSPFAAAVDRPLTEPEIGVIVIGCITAIAGLQQDGFDGVQLHAAHGGLFSRFLSPYSNRRTDQYGGSVRNRVRIVRQIVEGARPIVGDFPILIKVNGTDYLPGGVDADSFPELAREIADCGVDAIEVSGGMWDCLARSEKELGFPPVPSPESHIRIGNPRNQSYFLPYAAGLDLRIPVILVGGNRDVERLEEIVQRGQADFIALCRPLIREPHLANRWLEGRGRSGTECFSCNGCLFEMWTNVEQGKPWFARCLAQQDRERLREAQRWLFDWVPQSLAENTGAAEPANAD